MFKKRVKKLQEILKQKKLDCFLVSNYHNIFYLTGFQGLSPQEREAYVLVTRKGTYLFTDGRYGSNIKYQISNSKYTDKISNSLILKLLTPGEGIVFHLQKIITEERIKTVGFESDDLKFAEHQKLKTALVGVQLIPEEKTVIKLRAIKEKAEIVKVQKACRIADNCLSEVIKTIKVGQTEKEIAFKLEWWLRAKGYDLAFEPIVAVDVNSSIPHHNTKTGNQKIKNNSIVLIDFGAKFENYLSDTTRMIFVDPDNSTVNIYSQLLDVYNKTLSQIRQSKEARLIDEYCRQLMQKKDLPVYPHSTGHGVGLETHELPKISQTSTDIISQSQILTIEPGIYFEGRWGMRVEDTTLIIKGGIEVLTKFMKEPLIIKST